MHPEHCTCAICGPYLRAQAAAAPLVPTGDRHDEHTRPRADVAAGLAIGIPVAAGLWATLGTRAIGPIALAAVVAVGLLARRDGLHRWPA